MAYFDHLHSIVYKTEQSRFIAARRMARSKIASKVAESLFSATIIAISLIALHKGNDVDLSNKISIITIIFSTFLLVLSLLFSSLEYEKRYDKFMGCAMQLGELRREMDRIKEENIVLSNEQENNLLERYNSILRKYDINHSSFDYQYFEAFQANKFCFCFWFRYYILDVAFLYWMIALIPIIIIICYILKDVLC